MPEMQNLTWNYDGVHFGSQDNASFPSGQFLPHHGHLNVFDGVANEHSEVTMPLDVLEFDP